jgi:hypothetical protein
MRRIVRAAGHVSRCAPALLLAVGITGPALTAQTSSAVSARPRTTADFAWLAGNWAGHFPGASTSSLDLTFQSPKGGLMSGIMRLYLDGKPAVVELMTLFDTPRGVELRIRHFSDSLSAMETTYRQKILLTRSTDSSDTFENSTPFDGALMSTQPRVFTWTRRGPNAMMAHSDLLDANGKPSTIDVSYQRVPSS